MSKTITLTVGDDICILKDISENGNGTTNLTIVIPGRGEFEGTANVGNLHGLVNGLAMGHHVPKVTITYTTSDGRRAHIKGTLGFKHNEHGGRRKKRTRRAHKKRTRRSRRA